MVGKKRVTWLLILIISSLAARTDEKKKYLTELKKEQADAAEANFSAAKVRLTATRLEQARVRQRRSMLGNHTSASGPV